MHRARMSRCADARARQRQPLAGKRPIGQVVPTPPNVESGSRPTPSVGPGSSTPSAPANWTGSPRLDRVRDPDEPPTKYGLGSPSRSRGSAARPGMRPCCGVTATHDVLVAGRIRSSSGYQSILSATAVQAASHRRQESALRRLPQQATRRPAAPRASAGRPPTAFARPPSRSATSSTASRRARRPASTTGSSWHRLTRTGAAAQPRREASPEERLVDPVREPKPGRAHVRHCRSSWLRSASRQARAGATRSSTRSWAPGPPGSPRSSSDASSSASTSTRRRPGKRGSGSEQKGPGRGPRCTKLPPGLPASGLVERSRRPDSNRGPHHYE